MTPRLSYRKLIVDYLLKRDGNVCRICMRELHGAVHIDHIVRLLVGVKML